MPYQLIERPEEVAALTDHLSGASSFALDCEAAGFHRYSDRLCLLQITVGETDFIVDPLAFDPAEALRAPIQDPETRLLMHGGDYDLRLLDRDLGLRARGIFDTQVAASLIGEESLGLSALLEKYLSVKLAKKYQRADWAKRPLPAEMLDYAASDTRYLATLAQVLSDKVDELGRTEWVAEEFELLEGVSWDAEEGPVDLVAKVKLAKDLSPRVLERLRAALEWRDEAARTMDRAPFRVADDRTLILLACEPPATVDALAGTKGMSRSLARDRGEELLAALRGTDEIADSDLRPYPRPDRSGPGRPTPEIEARFERLKRLRNQMAADLGLARGTLFPNATLMEIARSAPTDTDALAEVPSLKRWQLALAGSELVRVSAGG